MRAKTKLTRLCGILLTLALLVGLLPTAALAADATATADFTSGDGTAALALLNTAKTGAADSTWVDDGNGNYTLTLNGVNFVTTAATAVILPANTTIVLADGTANTIKGGDSSSEDCYGIYVDNGSLTIQGKTAGTGKLIVNGGTATGTDKESYGIRVEKGDVTITGGTVEVTGGAATHKSSGIYAKRKDNGSGGYIGGNINISGGAEVTAAGGEVTDAKSLSYGLFANEAMTIADSAKVTATGGASSNKSYGIRAYKGNVTISGTANVTATGGAAGNNSCGIYSDNGNVEISGGAVKAKAGSATSAAALNKAPTLPTTTYWWRTSDSGIFAESTKSAYEWSSQHDYVEIQDPTPAYTVSFNANGGKVNGKDTDTATTNAAGQLATLPTPTRSGYTFKEWNTKQDGTGTTVATSTKFDANTTVYAQWGVATYTVSFNANGGGGTMADQSGVSGDYPLPENGFTAPAGQQFKGWATALNGSVISGTSITVTADTTLYAIWEDIPATYTVTWKSQDGSGTLETDTGVAYNAAPSFGGAAPTKADDDQYTYTFAGWATSENQESGTAVGNLPVVTGNVIYYAAFSKTAKSYAVTLNTNGATSCDALTTYTFGTGATLPTPTKTGYTFGGWYDNSSFTGEAVTVIAADATGAKTFYAKWNAISSGGIYTPPTHKVESTVSKDADGSVSFSKASAKKGDTVTITVTPDRYYKTSGVIVKDASGRMIAVTDNGNGTFTFQMPDSKVTVEPVFSWDNPFVDVAGDAYYAPAVEWALKNDITNGTSATTFSPNAGCTRGQIVTFLWRAAGCPEPKSSVNPFTDVSADAYYAKAVAWAAEQGITGGTGDGKFSPDAVCTRGQIVTFLWRAEKSPAVGTANPFTDVEADAYYAGATNWAVENGITEGTGDGTTFSPANDCTRAQIVTFLYRFFVK